MDAGPGEFKVMLGEVSTPRDGPEKRWIQAFTVKVTLVVVMSMFILVPVLFVAMLCFLYTFWIPVLYIIWMIFDWRTPESGGRTVHCIRDAAFWRHFADYFPVTVVKTVELDSSQNYLLCTYPHGLAPMGAFCGLSGVGGATPFPNMKTNIVTLVMNYRIPLVRELSMGMGGVAASERSIVHVLRDPDSGRVLVLVLGGEREQKLVHPDKNHIILRQRTGFCRIALQEGISLVPSFSFGENRVSRRLYPCGEKFSVPAPCPSREPVTVVVGEPIPTEKVENPSKEQILELRQRFEDALVKLYESYRHISYPGEDVPLIIE